MGSVGVVIPVLSQFEMAVDMIASINSSQRKVETFVIPNYRNQIPLSAAWNQGIDKAFLKSHEYVLVCNDDILLAPHTIDAMYWAAKKTDNAVVTARNLRDSISNPDSILEWSDEGDYLNPDVSGGPDFSCFMIGWAAWRHVGRFDENFTPAYFEDNDYHRRIALAGMTAGSVRDAPMYHYGSQTQNADKNNPVCPPDIFINNRKYYSKKWGGEPGKERFDTPFNDPNKSWRDW